MPLLVWNARMKIGIQSMDHQHQYWILLMNNLHDALYKNTDKTIAYNYLTGMLNYTRTHFVDEERLLFENSYPDYASHKELHDDFIRQLEKLRKSVEQGLNSDWSLVLEIIKLMSKWLKDHIQGSDQKYASFLKEKGVE